MTVEHSVSIGTFECPECGHTQNVTMSPLEARAYASQLVAATTPGMQPTMNLRPRGGC